MAESTMEIKHSGPTLDVSVSFGRFQSDSLSWEKWSSFSPNKYLEEVEKCSTPGSVAQKKAYFEAHYKMIAARKASEQMELEKLTESDSHEVDLDLKSLPEVIDSATSDFDHSNGKDVEVETCQISSASTQQNIHQIESLDNLGVSNVSLEEFTSLNETKEESKKENTHLNESKIKADQKTEIEKTQNTEIENTEIEKTQKIEIEKTEITEIEKTQRMEMEKKTQKTEIEKKTHLNESKIKTDQKTEIEKTQKIEIEETHITEIEKSHITEIEKTQRMEMEKKTQKTAVNIKDDSKLDASKKSQKVRNSAEIKKKSTLQLIRSPQVSTQNIPKQLSTSLVASSSSPYQPSSSVRKSKTAAMDSKRIAPSSFHMSMSLGHANSNNSSSSTRKSLIMEKMGDKDIVKRAFRTFQNSFNQLRSSEDNKSTQRKQISANETQQKVASSSSVTLRKENNSTRKSQPVKINETLRSQPGSKGTKLPGLVKAPAMDQRKAKPAPSLGLRNDDRAEILKSGKKLEDKTANTKWDGKTYISPNPKVEKGKGRVSEPKPNLNMNKSNNRPNLYQAKSTSKKKSLLEMDGAELEKHYQLEPRA